MLYDDIGTGYRRQRIPDARIARALRDAIGEHGSIVNIGAGTGSYEPADRCVAAIEPSMTMIRQRSPGAAPAIQALASRLPLRGACVDVAMAVLTIHHWTDRTKGFAEMARAARRRVVFLTWDPQAPGFWLTEDYFPEILELDRRIFPSLGELCRSFGSVSSRSIPIPHDCTDGFTGAFWRRPFAYLDPSVRAGMSTFSKIGAVKEGVERLRQDLDSGVWDCRYGHLLRQDAIDLGYRVVTVQL
jgi:SAM-dependent methyltransferase